MKYLLILVVIVSFEKSFCSYLRSCTEEKVVNKNNTEYRKIGPPIFYYDVESVLKKIQNSDNPGIQKLLEYYYRAKEANNHLEVSGSEKRYPLIVVEGLSGSGKTTLAGYLLKKVNGTQFHTPPRSIQQLKIRRGFRDNFVLDTAYHVLSNYITAIEVNQLLKDSPVIIDRYWHSTASFGIAHAVNNYPDKYVFPPKGDEIYNWPDDLMKPDMVLFLDVDENTRKQRIFGRNQITVQNSQTPTIETKQIFTRPDGLGNFMNRCPEFRINLIQAYKNMQNPGVTVINAGVSIPLVLEEVYSKIKHLFPTISFN